MKAPKAGGEIDSWCTKCRRMVGHRIIAMVGPKPARVECLSCSSPHNYRATPPGEKAEKAASSGRAAGPKSTGARASMTRAAQELRAREQAWEQAIAGKAVSDFRRYKVSETFREGDLIKHTKFGDGVITRILDSRKVEVLFKDEPRTLAQGLVD